MTLTEKVRYRIQLGDRTNRLLGYGQYYTLDDTSSYWKYGNCSDLFKRRIPCYPRNDTSSRDVVPRYLVQSSKHNKQSLIAS